MTKILRLDTAQKSITIQKVAPYGFTINFVDGSTRSHSQAASSETEHVFILAGQSNMVGRANFDDGIGYPAVVTQYNQSGNFIAATSPLDHTGEYAGDMGLALQFSIDYVQANPEVTVILIPCAQGGTSFRGNNWNVGDSLYEALITRVNAVFTAKPSAVLKGFLWHQGESDGGDEATYISKFTTLITDAKSRVSKFTDATPIIVGGLVADTGAMTTTIATIPDIIVRSAFASSTGLTAQDALHFNSAGLRNLGARYHTALAAALANDLSYSEPTAPTSFSVTEGNTVNTIDWAAPSSDGGAAVTGYSLERSIDDTSYSVVYSGPLLTYSDTGLTNGNEYFYKVRAQNSVGFSVYSATWAGTPVSVANEPSTIEAYDFASNPESATSYTFPNITTGTGDLVIAVAFRNGNQDVSIVGATPILTRFEVNLTAIQFFVIPNVTAGTRSITVNAPSNPSRIGVHCWTIVNGDVSTATIETSATTGGTMSVDIPVSAGSTVLALYAKSFASTSDSWTGVTKRQAWTNYGDAFGTGWADLEVAAASTLTVSSTNAIGEVPALAVLHIPSI
jgi:hypothetical protein